MKSRILLAIIVLATAPLFILSCSSKDKKKGDSKSNTETTVGPSKNVDDMIPSIDIAALKDEASVLDAMQKVVDARIADEKKQKDDPNFAGHYVELTKLYTAVLNASTEFTKTITDPAKAVEFGNKLSAIQDKMYAK